MNQAAIEQALYLQALQNSSGQVSPEEAALYGAGIGGTLGLGAGVAAHDLGRLINNLKDRVNPYYPTEKLKKVKDKKGNPLMVKSQTPMPRNQRNKFIPGNRMAGALVGFVLGGGAGPAIAQSLTDESDEARLLAKVQMGVELNEYELALLEDIATKHYDNIAQFSRSA